MKQNKLPKGAKMLPKPIRKQTGGWVEQEFDAKLDVLGMTWYRVKDGFGGRADREDWVADLPGICISVHDYHWNGDDFGANHGSFLGAIKAETKRTLLYAIQDEEELKARLTKQQNGIKKLREVIAKF